MIGRLGHLLRMQPPSVDNRGLLYLSGATVPTDGTDGYQTGCLFQHTNGGDNDALYVNEGTVTDCEFKVVATGAAEDFSAIEFDDNLTGPTISISTDDPTGDTYTTPFLITGTYSSTCALGLQLSATNQRPVTFVFDDGGEILGSGNYRAVLSRVMLCSTQTGQVAIRAIRGQIKVADGLTINIATNEMNAINGVEGYIELAGTTARTVGANTRVAAVHGLVEVRQDITLTAGGYVAGLFAELCQTTAKTVDGVGTMGVLVDRLDSDHTDAQAKWGTGLMIASGACTTGINIASGTTPDTARTNHALVIGGRGAAELTVTFTANTALNYEPIQTNFDMAGVAPTSTSTVNIWQGAITHDTRDMANLRLKFTDLLTEVNFDCKDVYIHQAEIKFGAAAAAVSGEVAVLGLVLDAGVGAITCPTYGGVSLTLRGAGTPANARGYFLNVVAGVTVASAMHVEANGTITTGLVFDCVPGAGTITNLLSVEITRGPAVATRNAGASQGSISILVDGAQKWVQYWAAAS